jgi:hypothetical protein
MEKLLNKSEHSSTYHNITFPFKFCSYLKWSPSADNYKVINAFKEDSFMISWPTLIQIAVNIHQDHSQNCCGIR